MTQALNKRGTALSVCVCTYRRAHLQRTLATLHAMDRPPHCFIHVIVVDNDADPSGQDIVEAFAVGSDLTVTYVHRPGGNISLARNACLDTASTDLVAFIDDDERVHRNWLVEILEHMRRTGANVVVGPVNALYSATAPTWMQRSNAHATRPVVVDGEIRTGYTCNVLMNVAAAPLAGRRFSLERGRSGGEDTAFFLEAWRDGASISYAETALVEEDVPDDRATFGWLAKRRFRSGQTHGGLLASCKVGTGRITSMAIAGAKIVYCLAAAFGQAPVAHRRNMAILRAALHTGTVSGLLGQQAVEIYGDGSTLSTEAS